MLNIENIKLWTESKSFLECIVFFKSKGYSFEGIQQRSLYLLVTHRPSKNFFKCYFIILQAIFHISPALPGQQNLFRVLPGWSNAKFCIAQQDFEQFSKGHKETYHRLKEGNDALYTGLFHLCKEHSKSFCFAKNKQNKSFKRQIRRFGFNLTNLFFSIYKDRSFHCDVCNVCLDKRLEGKHKCRPNSGHDECCICLEVTIDHILYF